MDTSHKRSLYCFFPSCSYKASQPPVDTSICYLNWIKEKFLEHLSDNRLIAMQVEYIAYRIHMIRMYEFSIFFLNSFPWYGVS